MSGLLTEVSGVPHHHGRAIQIVVDALLARGFDVHIHLGGGAIAHPAWNPKRPGNNIGWPRPGVDANPAVIIRVEYRTYAHAPLLWPLVHEFGHALLGDPQSEESCAAFHDPDCPDREQAAWDAGWSELRNAFDELGSDDGEAYRAAAAHAVGEYRKRPGPCRRCGRA